MALGARVRAARRSRTWSQQELSDRTGIGRSSLSSIEAGKPNITVEVLWRLGGALHLHWADLLDDRAAGIPAPRAEPAPFNKQLTAFGTRLYETRVLQHLSQQDLTARTGINRSVISQIELGTQNINLVTLSRLAAGLHVHWADLLDDRQPNPPRPHDTPMSTQDDAPDGENKIRRGHTITDVNPSPAARPHASTIDLRRRGNGAMPTTDSSAQDYQGRWDPDLFAQQLATLGEQIRAVRQSRAWSQQDLGSRAEIDRANVSRIEGGKKNITLELLWRLANTLQVQSADLLDDRLADLPETVTTSLPFVEQLSAVGRRVYDARVLLRISQSALAERTGLGCSTISWIEDQSRNVTLETLSRLAAGLGMHWADLLDNRQTNPPPPGPRQGDGVHERRLHDAAAELAEAFDRHDRPRLARLSNQHLQLLLNARRVLYDYADQMWRDAHRRGRNLAQPEWISISALRDLAQHLMATALDEWTHRPDTL